MRAPDVKICGLMRRQDAQAAADAGASYAGVILSAGYRRSVTASDAAALLSGLPLHGVGVFVNAVPAELAKTADRAGIEVVQLHGDEDESYIEQIRQLGGWAIWKAVRPRSSAEFAAAVDRYGALLDGLLVDGWSPSARGGSGVRFPWRPVARERQRLPARLALIAAGGLDPSNVSRASALLRPHVVDVSSGVEATLGEKDASAIRAFVAAARAPVESQPG